MSLEKILILGVALLVIGGVYVFAESVGQNNIDAAGVASGNQAHLETTMGIFVFD